jgi:hypothetical protein
MMGSALGYQRGRRDAEELARLQSRLVESIEVDLRQKTTVPVETGVATQGVLLESV